MRGQEYYVFQIKVRSYFWKIQKYPIRSPKVPSHVTFCDPVRKAYGARKSPLMSDMEPCILDEFCCERKEDILQCNFFSS